MDVNVSLEGAQQGTPEHQPEKHFETPGLSFSWKNLRYEVESRGFCCKRNEKETKTILKGVHGVVLPGQFVALMGPSGSGKSTLLDLLTGRVGIPPRPGLSGEIRINGKLATSSDIKQNIAYIMQDDALYSMLSVRENLYYSAMLRLPNTMTKEEKLARVEEVIEELGLSHCADTKIGNSFFRGVSGGERRRCSIGMELITRPSILLLDEPTSGLDSKSSRMIIETLKRLALSSGKTILMTIHQPSSQIFQLFDKVLLLSDGKQIYFGTIDKSIAFFDSTGNIVPMNTNPSDHFLETINLDFEAGEHKNHDKLDQLAQTFEESEDFAQMTQLIEKQEDEPRNELSNSKKKNMVGRQMVTPFTTQLNYLLRRTFLNGIRDPGVFW
eukprot:CAMPEP_0201489170 /NCGR_PEP_ID=MMETSP0151_2-20130828/21059_1 /ASSEMBLY_ACC=CAM_ASM_000257 /TAXON_ID=200890 /ORGANISM="Paramoeba atlantica, Strain 621/1 / CCAP 1560/9" /LENGTH=383 /DNA_ID=CAMNT_0047874663 /DNA_START=127 /DNA_END=1275 /DNA_ORIENTATION=-